MKVAWTLLSLLLFVGILIAFHSCSKVEQPEATFVEETTHQAPLAEPKDLIEETVSQEETEVHEETVQVVQEETLPDTGGA